MQEFNSIIDEFKKALPDAQQLMTDDMDAFDKLGKWVET